MRQEFRKHLLEDEAQVGHGGGKSVFDQALRLQAAKGAAGLLAKL